MKILLLTFSLLLLLSCCKKDSPEPELPPISATGANTFGCRINGKVWLPSRRPKGNLPQIEGGIVTRYDTVGPEKNWYDLLIFAYNDDNSGFQIYLSRINSPGTYLCKRNVYIWPVSPQPDFSYLYYYSNGKKYVTNPHFNGEVNLARYDTLVKVFSGTFSFTAYSGTDTVKVSDGRFDINQRQIN